jgi:uncharacterized membrane protein YbhN (UPF0104 family)
LPAFFDGLGALTEGRRFLAVMGWLLLNWSISVGQYYLLVRAFFPQIRLLWSTFTLGATAFGMAVPAAPGSLGAYEATMVGALNLVFKLDYDIALACATVAHLLNYLLTGALGVYALATAGIKLNSLIGLYQALRQQDAATTEEKTKKAGDEPPVEHV